MPSLLDLSPLPLLRCRYRPRRVAGGMHTQSPQTGHVDQTHCLAAVDQAIAYHVRTKHSLLSGYARGPGRLDWANQPNPFLRFLPSSDSTALPLPPLPVPPISYPSLFASLPPPSPLSAATLSSLLFHSLSLSAWKTTGFSTWSLRVNPSSGNLHPTETHLLLPGVAGISDVPFLAHYSPKNHALEIRAVITPSDQLYPLPLSSSFIVVFSSIFWREAWKYGERAFRYCNHDVGHAVAALAISAAAIGWDTRILDGLSHSDLDSLLGVPWTHQNVSKPENLPEKPARGNFPWVEEQHPDCAVLLFPNGSAPEIDYANMVPKLEQFGSLKWKGEPNSLSKEHVMWDVIYRTAEAVKKPVLNPRDVFSVNTFHKSGLIGEGLYRDLSVYELVRKRRSAVDMDGVHVMKREVFYQIMLHCLPSGEVALPERQGKQNTLPFRVLTWDAEVHAVLFVHRVSGLPKGVYFLVRNEAHFDSLRQATRSEFEWVSPEGCPDGLPLYRLVKGDCQQIAKQLSCHQDIASDGCFSLGMVARFEPVLREKSSWMYPRLFWETGVLGQVLYLEAHAVGISATGIGCYFDDAVHDVLGLKGLEFQSLYHFTIGGPVVDKRIMSLPAYPGPQLDA